MKKYLPLIFLFLFGCSLYSYAIVGDSCTNPCIANLCGNGAFSVTTTNFTNSNSSWTFGGNTIYNDGPAIYYEIDVPTGTYQPVSLSALFAGYYNNCNGCSETVNFFWFENSPCSSNPLAVNSYTISGNSSTQDSILVTYPVVNAQAKYYLVIGFSYSQQYLYSLQLGFTNNQPLPTPTCSPAPAPYKGMLELDQSKCYTASNPYNLPLSALNDNPAYTNLLYPNTLNQNLNYLPISDDNGNGFILSIKTTDYTDNLEIYKWFDQFPYTYSTPLNATFGYDVALTVFFKNNGGASGLKGFRIQVPNSYGGSTSNAHPNGSGIYDPTGNWTVTYDNNSSTYTWLFNGKTGRGDNVNNNGYGCQVYTFDAEFQSMGDIRPVAKLGK